MFILTWTNCVSRVKKWVYIKFFEVMLSLAMKRRDDSGVFESSAHLLLYGSEGVTCFGVMKQELGEKERRGERRWAAAEQTSEIRNRSNGKRKKKNDFWGKTYSFENILNLFLWGNNFKLITVGTYEHHMFFGHWWLVYSTVLLYTHTTVLLLHNCYLWIYFLVT